MNTAAQVIHSADQKMKPMSLAVLNILFQQQEGWLKKLLKPPLADNYLKL